MSVDEQAVKTPGRDDLTSIHATVDDQGSAVIVSVSGEVDISNVADWERVLNTATTGCAPGSVVVVDVRNMGFIGGCAFGALDQQAQRCRDRGASLRLVSQQPSVARITELCGMGQLLSIYPTIKTALSGGAT